MRKNKSHKRSLSRRRNYKPNNNNAQKGGSPASNIVMSDATMNPPVMNDYAGADRIRDSWYDASLSSANPKFASHSGGSLASNLVNEQLTGKPDTKSFDPAWSPKGDMNSLNLYETTGGARRHRSRRNKSSIRSNNSRSRKHHKKHTRRNSKSKSNRRNRRNNNSRKHRTQRGGASDWIMSQYSLGNINASEQPGSWVSQFSKNGATGRNELMNPSTLGLAGSGYPMGGLEGGSVSHVGAPI
jgi:hypothetical protein